MADDAVPTISVGLAPRPRAARMPARSWQNPQRSRWRRRPARGDDEARFSRGPPPHRRSRGDLRRRRRPGWPGWRRADRAHRSDEGQEARTGASSACTGTSHHDPPSRGNSAWKKLARTSAAIAPAMRKPISNSFHTNAPLGDVGGADAAPRSLVTEPLTQGAGQAFTGVHVHAFGVLGVLARRLGEPRRLRQAHQHRHDGDQDGGADEQGRHVLPAEEDGTPAPQPRSPGWWRRT